MGFNWLKLILQLYYSTITYYYIFRFFKKALAIAQAAQYFAQQLGRAVWAVLSEPVGANQDRSSKTQQYFTRNTQYFLDIKQI